MTTPSEWSTWGQRRQRRGAKGRPGSSTGAELRDEGPANLGGSALARGRGRWKGDGEREQHRPRLRLRPAWGRECRLTVQAGVELSGLCVGGYKLSFNLSLHRLSVDMLWCFEYGTINRESPCQSRNVTINIGACDWIFALDRGIGFLISTQLEVPRRPAHIGRTSAMCVSNLSRRSITLSTADANCGSAACRSRSVEMRPFTDCRETW